MKYLLLILVSLSVHADTKTPESEFMSGCLKGLAKRFPTEKDSAHQGFCTVLAGHSKGEMEKQKNPTHFGCWKAIEEVSVFYGQDLRTQYQVNCL